jgi:hypothetical protein
MMSWWGIRCFTKSKFEKGIATKLIGVVSSILDSLMVFPESYFGNTVQILSNYYHN